MADQSPNKATRVDIDSLLTQIGSRTMPDTEKTASSKAQVHQHWQQMVQKQKQQSQKKYVWAMAASVLLVATITLLNMNPTIDTEVTDSFAKVQNYQGDVQFRQKRQWLPIQQLTVVDSATEIRTAQNSYLNLQLTDNSELRVAANTSLVTGQQSIELQHGKIYHDTDVTYQAAPLTIKTSQGLVQHIGTRYMVNQQADVMQIAVRSGQVKMTPDDSADTVKTLQANQLLTSSANEGSQIEPVQSYDGIWDWTFAAQPAFELKDKSLYEFVQWYAHQTGLIVDWQNLESPSKRIRLQGNIKNMSAEQAIQTVFYSTKYSYSIDQGILQIKQQNQ